MIEDHGKANERLIGLAKEDGIAVPDKLDRSTRPCAPGSTWRTAPSSTWPTSGAGGGHQKTVQLLEYEIGSGQDVELKSFAAEILPIVLQHLRAVQDIQAELRGKAI